VRVPQTNRRALANILHSPALLLLLLLLLLGSLHAFHATGHAPQSPLPHTIMSSSMPPPPPALPTRTRKGVTYAPAGAEGERVVGCLFCDLVNERIPGGAPLWYSDDDVAVFVPRTPAAALHFLVVPKRHVKNLSVLTPDDLPLLAKMKAVARQCLSIHGAHLPELAAPLPRCAPPPTAYSFPRNRLLLEGEGPSADGFDDEGRPTGAGAGAAAPRWRLDFHAPPYNSIDHLHLHALHLPFSGWWDRMTFMKGAPWTASAEEAVARALKGRGSGAGAGGAKL
jgi:hypothetical protein